VEAAVRAHCGLQREEGFDHITIHSTGLGERVTTLRPDGHGHQVVMILTGQASIYNEEGQSRRPDHGEPVLILKDSLKTPRADKTLRWHTSEGTIWVHLRAKDAGKTRRCKNGEACTWTPCAYTHDTPPIPDLTWESGSQ
jgi:hypothetical protein